MLLQVQSGGVNVCRGDADAVFQGFRADDEDVQGLAAVVDVELIACLDGLTEGVRNKAVCLCHLDAFVDRFALGLGVVKELCVRNTECLRCVADFLCQTVERVLLLVEQLFLQLLSLGLIGLGFFIFRGFRSKNFFFHDISPFRGDFRWYYSNIRWRKLQGDGEIFLTIPCW